MPELVEELAVTITRRDRIGTPGSAGRKQAREQPLPFNVAAAEAADDLHTTLVAWVRHEGSGEAVDEIQYAMRRARWATDRRPEDSAWVDPELVNEARSAIGTAADLERILRGMGDAALTRKRTTYLDRVGELKRIALADGTTVFEVGDVPDAQEVGKLPARERRRPGTRERVTPDSPRQLIGFAWARELGNRIRAFGVSPCRRPDYRRTSATLVETGWG
ncbi:hypothetical protein [Rhodococcus jostii]|uniref:hypothetical protein n=1 Tax=Rhodococcus jostii TaxID=132919 RepID=UPI00363B4103